MNQSIGRGRRVYVAGPVNGSGRQHANAHRAMHAAKALRDAGFEPFVPHMFWLYHFLFPETTEEQVLEWCASWVRCCDFLIRLPGESSGSEFEMLVAQGEGIPIFKCHEGIDDDYLTPARLLIEHCRRNNHPDIAGPAYRVNTDYTDYAAIETRMAAALGWEWDEEELRLAHEQDRAPRPIVATVYSHLNKWQAEVGNWISKQPFSKQARHSPLLGMLEELGELSRAHLKNEQKIRGFEDEAKTRAAKEDAIGDLFVFAAGYCRENGLQLGDCLKRAWSEVEQRDWNKNQANGKVDMPPGYESGFRTDALKVIGGPPGPYSEKWPKGRPAP